MRRTALLLMVIVTLLPLCCCRSHRQAQSTHHTSQNSIPASTANTIIREAERWIGTPYSYGAQTRRKGTDCSGMTMVIFRDKAGVQLPRNAAAQQQACMPVRRQDLQPGDLVFFKPGVRSNRVSHVGIYRGNGEFIHASRSSGVKVSSLDEKYYITHYHSAGRIPQLATAHKTDRRESGPHQGAGSSAATTPQGPPRNYIEVVFNADSPSAAVAIPPVMRDTIAAVSDTAVLAPDTIAPAPADLWHRAEAELDSIISASLDSLQ